MLLVATLVAAPVAARERVVLVGDSVTVGPRDGAIAYGDLLGLALGKTHTVVNLAIGGTSTRDWLPGTPCFAHCEGPGGLFTQKVATALPAAVVVVLLGTNDALGYRLPEPHSADTYEQNLRKLAGALVSAGAERILLLTPPPVAVGAASALQSRLSDYAARVRALCLELERTACGPDLFVEVDRSADFEASDKIHLNRAAHTRIGTSLARILGDDWPRRTSVPRAPVSGIVSSN